MSHHVADVDERLTFTDRTGLWVRRLCVPIVLFWVVVAGLTNALCRNWRRSANRRTWR